MSNVNPADRDSTPGDVQGRVAALEVTEFAMEVSEFAVVIDESSGPAEEIVKFLPQDRLGAVPAFPNPLRHPLRAVGWLMRFAFGIASLIFFLAVIAAVPIVNFLALGYLLEVEARVARTGKLRFAFPLLGQAPRFGSIALGLWLWLLPLRLLAGAVADARLVEPDGPAVRTLSGFMVVAAAIVAVHLCLALARGGSLGCFVRPIRNVVWLVGRLREGGYWDRSSAGVRAFLAGLRLRHHFWLGFRGFVGALGWLFVPSAMFAALDETQRPDQAVVTILGGLLLVVVLTLLPFLQARFAAENRLRAFVEVRAVGRLFSRAPITWLAAAVLLDALALPLYLLKVALPPADAMWLVTIVFIASIYPARVAVGWAYHRAANKVERRVFGLGWIVRRVMLPLMCLAAMLPILGTYVFVLFFTPSIGAHGKAVLFQHHAFLLPVPF